MKEKTVRINGFDYEHCELVREGGKWGILTPETSFWMFPLFDGEGSAVQKPPPGLPREIRALTLVKKDRFELDRDEKHAEYDPSHFGNCKGDVKKLFNQVGPSGYPFKLEQEIDQFIESCKNDFEKWLDEDGRLETVVDPGMTDYAPVVQARMVARAQNIRLSAAWALVKKVRRVAVFGDSAHEGLIYLHGMREEPTIASLAKTERTVTVSAAPQPTLQLHIVSETPQPSPSRPDVFYEARDGSGRWQPVEPYMMKRGKIREELGRKKGDKDFRKLIGTRTAYYINTERNRKTVARYDIREFKPGWKVPKQSAK